MWNLAFDVAFELITERRNQWTDAEWLAALKRRVAYLESHPAELAECAQSSEPYDAYEIGQGVALMVKGAK
jgi:hypothetical protein